MNAHCTDCVCLPVSFNYKTTEEISVKFGIRKKNQKCSHKFKFAHMNPTQHLTYVKLKQKCIFLTWPHA